MEKPKGIRIEVPPEYGSAYTNEADDREDMIVGEREWVERRQRKGKSLVKGLQDIENIFTEDKAFKEASKLLSQTFTDWTLSSDEGPLPKPWGNAKAFEALLESDLEVMLWVIRTAYMRTPDLVQTEKN